MHIGETATNIRGSCATDFEKLTNKGTMISKTYAKSPEDATNKDHGNGILGCSLQNGSNDKCHSRNYHGPAYETIAT